MPGGSYADRLLVAPPNLGDPNFSGTVVLVLVHNEGGAFGLVLNREHPIELGLFLPQWAAVATAPVLAGGPVETGALIGLARPRPGAIPEAFTPMSATLEALGTVDLQADPGPDLDMVRVFAGYSGWAPGQLDAEVDLGGWLIVDAHPDDPFTSDLDGLWGRVLRRHHGHQALHATFPDDPERN